MKRYCIILIALPATLSLNAQHPGPHSPILKISKPPLDTSTFSNWATIRDNADCGISNDGAYAYYHYQASFTKPVILAFQRVGGDWHKEFYNAGTAAFSADSKKAICMVSDSLCIVRLREGQVEYLPGVQSFQLKNIGNRECLLFQQRDHQLVVRSMSDNWERRFPGVMDWATPEGKAFSVLLRDSVREGKKVSSLEWVDLLSGKEKNIWQGDSAWNFVFDSSGRQLAFSGLSHSDRQTSYYYFKDGRTGAIPLLADSSLKDREITLDRIVRFTSDNGSVIFYLKDRTRPAPDPANAGVDVWSYTDVVVQAQQLQECSDPFFEARYVGVVRVSDDSLTYLQDRSLRSDRIAGIVATPGSDLVVYDGTKGDYRDYKWSSASQPSNVIVSLRTGRRDTVRLFHVRISPDGKYAIGEEGPEYGDLVVCNLASGKKFNLSQSIPIPQLIPDWMLWPTKELHNAGWIDGATLIVYDHYDIWKVDAEGRKPPINLTRSYGRTHNCVLRLIEGGDDGKGHTSFVSFKNEWLATCFNFGNKEQAFYGVPSDLKDGFVKISKKSCICRDDLGMVLTKARDTDKYLFKMWNAGSSPNYFSTSDFLHFDTISSLYPERNYNWLSSELINFRSLDGRVCQGIVYKPEDFDPSKRYPVILSYYEKRSDKLNDYLEVFDRGMSDFSIPWFVSHGYVVVVPDIYFSKGKIGQSALNSVLGVTRYLETLPWVNVKKIGLQGQSFGGFETNYIVTHTSRFAAAVSSSGVVDQISQYGSLWGNDGPPVEGYMEIQQARMGGSLWENQEAYLENSPILVADKLSTPMLLIANKNDGNVHYQQGLEFYLAMRRMGKPGWMLQYDGGGHGLLGKDFVDFTMRSQQFFDHYLKDAPAPRWMVEGIPACRKGVDMGFELEPAGVEPRPGLLIKK